MTYSEAKRKAEDVLNDEFSEESFQIVINEAHSFRFSRGWVFRYNTREFIEDQETDYCLLVTEPIVIDEIDGTISRLTNEDFTFRTAEERIIDYIKSKEQ